MQLNNNNNTIVDTI